LKESNENGKLDTVIIKVKSKEEIKLEADYLINFWLKSSSPIAEFGIGVLIRKCN